MEIDLEGVLLGLIGGGLGALAGLSIIGVIMQTLNWTDGVGCSGCVAWNVSLGWIMCFIRHGKPAG